VIQKATKDMLSQLIALWSECFGDSEEYSSFFFQNKMIGTEVFENEYVYRPTSAGDIDIVVKNVICGYAFF